MHTHVLCEKSILS